ncbi:hypothetical protein D9M71_701820 [compost metagenome]
MDISEVFGRFKVHIGKVALAEILRSIATAVANIGPYWTGAQHTDANFGVLDFQLLCQYL